MSEHVSPELVAHTAQLANIPISPQEEQQFATAFTDTLATIQSLESVDVTGVEPTHQVTGLENVLREDSIDTNRMFSQQQALANAARQHQGFFVIPQVLQKDE